MYNKYKMLVPVLVLAQYSLVSAINSMRGVSDIQPQHIGGYIAVVITIISFFVVRKYYKYFLIATLILGLGNFISFTNGISSVTLGIGGLKITFQEVSFFVAILAGIMSIPMGKKDVAVNAGQFSADNEKRMTEDVDRFKEKFKHKSPAELSAIIEGSGYTAAAVEAAKQLLN